MCAKRRAPVNHQIFVHCIRPEFVSSLFSLEYSRFAQASLQVRRPSSSSLPTKPCDKPCFNGGSCLDGNCACPAGKFDQSPLATFNLPFFRLDRPQCDSCFGRIAISTKKNTSSKGYLTDGPLNYSASAKCVWIIEGDDEGPLLLRLEEFFTECCWDHLLIYDGDNVFNNLIAAFSGNLPAGTQLVAKSGKAIVYFISDLAFNLPVLMCLMFTELVLMIAAVMACAKRENVFVKTKVSVE
uniref:CUB domain-containing protein n=1 Tax=Ditylenchus dipsaci TaxID=166011 RepID=A0A915DZ93_9BILA